MEKGKNFSNSEIVQKLKEVMAAMEIKGLGRFRIRAYDNAITSLENLTISIKDLWEDGRLNDVPGIGFNIANHLDELFSKGIVKEWENVKKDLPDGMFSLLGIRGVGAKKAYKLSTVLSLNSRETAVDDLKRAAQEHKIEAIPGFGPKSQTDILDAIELAKKTKNEKPRMLLIQAESISDRVLTHMKLCPHIERIDVLGSFRRRNPTVGDLDFVAATTKPDLVIEHFLQFPEITEILAHGENKVMVVLSNDVQCDLRLTSPKTYGAMLQYNTGNVQHNILLRTYALEKGYSLSEYGIKDKNTQKIHEFDKEENFYKFLGLQYIPPEIRYGNNEIELAKTNDIPNLVTLSDIKGDLHVHSNYSMDGTNTIKEIVDAAKVLGYKYIGISDHSPSIQSKTLSEINKQIDVVRDEIEKINETESDIKILFGYEVNILVDNKLSLPDEILKKLDYVIAGVHSSLNQDRELMTARIIAALENPYVDIIAHPLNRLINSREACDINWVEVFKACIDNNKILEINGQPDRLDLPDDLVKEAINRNIMLIVSSDAHQIFQLTYMRYAIDTARRGWGEKKHFINTYDYDNLIRRFGNR